MSVFTYTTTTGEVILVDETGRSLGNINAESPADYAVAPHEHLFRWVPKNVVRGQRNKGYRPKGCILCGSFEGQSIEPPSGYRPVEYGEFEDPEEALNAAGH